MIIYEKLSSVGGVKMSIEFTPNESAFFKKRTDFLKILEENPPFTSPAMRLEQLGKETPEKIGLLFEDKTWTWGSINEESNKYSNYFLNLGLKPREAVAMMLENSPEFLFCMMGINKIQGIGALLNTNLKKQSLIHIIKISEPKFIVIDGDCLPSIIDVFKDLNMAKSSIFVINNPKRIPHDFTDLSAILNSFSTLNPETTANSALTHIANYIYTSGTTGYPKAVLIRNVTFGKYYMDALEAVPEDIFYIPLPLYHSHGNVTLKGVIYLGATIALKKRFSASEYWKDIKKYQATCTPYIGELPRYLINRPESEYVPGPLKKLLGLGLRKDIWDNFKTRFNIDKIVEFYGGTDLGIPFINLEGVPGMVGRNVLPNYEIIKVDEDTEEFVRGEDGLCVRCNPGEIGMAMVKIEYDENYALYKNRESTMKKILFDVIEKGDAFLKSGDLVKLHEDNWVSFADRVGDTFRWKGENVSTLEVESILNKFPSIEICNVFGVAISNYDGKAGMAAIKLNIEEEFHPDQFSSFVSDNLPDYSIPIFLRIKDELEFTGTHKLRKVNLRKEGFDLEKVKDPLYFWDGQEKKYIPFDATKYQMLVNGKLRV